MSHVKKVPVIFVNMVIIEEEQVETINDDEFETPGINDPKPTCRKSISQKRKKKKGKKSYKMLVSPWDEISAVPIRTLFI